MNGEELGYEPSAGNTFLICIHLPLLPHFLPVLLPLIYSSSLPFMFLKCEKFVHALDMGGLLMWLLLLGREQAAQVAAAPQV